MKCVFILLGLKGGNMKKFISTTMMLLLLTMLFGLNQVSVYAADASPVITIDEPEYYTENERYYPDLGMSLTSGYAPFPVFAQGWESAPRESIIEYAWDFGVGTETDEGGRYFSGLNGYHVYENPGEYWITLRVKTEDGSWSEETRQRIEVLESPDNASTYYIDAEIGNDSYDGKSMTVGEGNSGPWKTATKALQQMNRDSQFAPFETWTYKPGDKILFKRGQTFDMSETFRINHGYATQGYYFGAYGDDEDEKPLIQYSGSTTNHLITPGNGFAYIGFVDLQFNFNSPNAQSDGLLFSSAYIKNILMLRCDFQEPDNGVFSISGLDIMRSNIFMVNSTISSAETMAIAGVQMYGNFIHGLVLANNNFDISGNHIGYFCYLDKALITDNVFSRPAFGRTALRITGGDFDHPGNNIYVARNHFMGWIDPIESGGSGRAGGAHNGGGNRYNYRLVHFGPNNFRANTTLMLEDILFEDNVISNGETLMTIANAERITVRNNVFISPKDGLEGIVISDPNPDMVSKPSKNIDIYNNAFICNTNNSVVDQPTKGSIIKVHQYTVEEDTGYGDRHENINIQNNNLFFSDERFGRFIQATHPNKNMLNASEISNQFNSDYNKIYVQSGGSMDWWYNIDNTSMTLDEWKNQSSNGSSSQLHEVSDGCLVSLHSPGYPNSSESNLYETSRLVSYMTQKFEEWEDGIVVPELPEIEVTISLTDDDEQPIIDGRVSYILDNDETYIGNTNGEGIVTYEFEGSIEDVTIKVEYNGQILDKTQNIQNQPRFDFIYTNSPLPDTEVVINVMAGNQVPVENAHITYSVNDVEEYIGKTNSSGLLTHYFDSSIENVRIRVDYEGEHLETTQNIQDQPNFEFVFNTAQEEGVTFKLLNSNNEPLSGGTVEVANGSWTELGVTNTEGELNVDLEPGKYRFKMKYGNGQEVVTKEVVDDTVIIFNTINVSIRLESSTGEGLENGTAQSCYYAWADAGKTNENGETNQELLPGEYRFKMEYGNGKQIIKQNITDNDEVVFTTIDTTISLDDSKGNGLADAEVGYIYYEYEKLGDTNESGKLHVELLPDEYKFRVKYDGGFLDTNQDVTENSEVIFQTMVVKVQLLDAEGNGIDGALIKHHREGWHEFGLTSNGEAEKELLPGTYIFNANLNKYDEYLKQDVNDDPIIVFVNESE